MEGGDCDDGYILQHTFSQRAPPPSKNGKMELIKIFIDFYFYLSAFYFASRLAKEKYAKKKSRKKKDRKKLKWNVI